MAEDKRHKYMPWYAEDWRKDLKVRKLCPSARCCYRELIDWCFTEGSFSDDLEALKDICMLKNVQTRDMARWWGEIKAQGFFYQGQDGLWRQVKVDRIRDGIEGKIQNIIEAQIVTPIQTLGFKGNGSVSGQCPPSNGSVSGQYRPSNGSVSGQYRSDDKSNHITTEKHIRLDEKRLDSILLDSETQSAEVKNPVNPESRSQVSDPDPNIDHILKCWEPLRCDWIMGYGDPNALEMIKDYLSLDPHWVVKYAYVIELVKADPSQFKPKKGKPIWFGLEKLFRRDGENLNELAVKYLVSQGIVWGNREKTHAVVWRGLAPKRGNLAPKWNDQGWKVLKALTPGGALDPSSENYLYPDSAAHNLPE